MKPTLTPCADCGTQESQQNSKHHYAFAHKVLPQIAFDHPVRIFAILASGERTRFFDSVLETLDTRIQDSRRRNFSGSDIKVTPCTIQGRACVILQMPPVRNPCEACFIALVSQLTPDQLDIALKAGETQGALDYYTFERPVSPQSNYKTVFCAWTADGTHLNYGNGPHPNLHEVVPFLNITVSSHTVSPVMRTSF